MEQAALRHSGIQGNIACVAARPEQAMSQAWGGSPPEGDQAAGGIGPGH